MTIHTRWFLPLLLGACTTSNAGDPCTSAGTPRADAAPHGLADFSMNGTWNVAGTDTSMYTVQGNPPVTTTSSFSYTVTLARTGCNVSVTTPNTYDLGTGMHVQTGEMLDDTEMISQGVDYVTLYATNDGTLIFTEDWNSGNEAGPTTTWSNVGTLTP